MRKCRRMKRQPSTSKKLDIFLTVIILEDTPAVLSLGKLCEDQRYSYEWTSGQKPCLIKNGTRIQCCTENSVPIVVPGLSTSSSSSSSSGSASPTSVPQESKSSTSIPASSEDERKATKGRRKPINFGPQGTEKNLFFRKTRMAARSQRKSCGWKSSRTWRLTRELFSWTLFRAAEASGTGQSQCFHTLPERPKLREMQEDQDYHCPVQKTYWWSHTSCRKIWWLD